MLCSLTLIEYIHILIKSNTLKRSTPLKYYLFILFVCSYLPILAQQKAENTLLINKKQQDSAYLKHPLKDAKTKLKNDIVKWGRVIRDKKVKAD
jgi:hypothetical protein